MDRSRLFVVLTAALTCALLAAGVVNALHTAAADPPLAAAGAPPGGASPDSPPATAAAPATTTTVAPSTSAPPTTAAPTTTTLAMFPSGLVIQPRYQVVSALGPVHALDAPGGAVVQTFDRYNAIDELTTLPVVSPGSSQGAAGWYEVGLPRRPNGSTGWVSGQEVTTGVLTKAIVVQLGAHKLSLFDRGVEVASYPVCIGTATNPTPTGVFFALGVIEPTPTGPYGPFAIPTSAYSDTLTDWPGGGVVGIHGTNAPDSIGKSVSHGCVRMYNKDITELTRQVVPGTPIFIEP